MASGGGSPNEPESGPPNDTTSSSNSPRSPVNDTASTDNSRRLSSEHVAAIVLLLITITYTVWGENVSMLATEFRARPAEPVGVNIINDSDRTAADVSVALARLRAADAKLEASLRAQHQQTQQQSQSHSPTQARAASSANELEAWLASKAAAAPAPAPAPIPVAMAMPTPSAAPTRLRTTAAPTLVLPTQRPSPGATMAPTTSSALLLRTPPPTAAIATPAPIPQMAAAPTIAPVADGKRPLRIYTYDLSALGLGLGALQNFKMHRESVGQFATQVFIPQWLRSDTRFRAAGPEDADLFFVPLMAKVLAHCLYKNGYWDAKKNRATGGVDPALAAQLFELSKRNAKDPRRGRFAYPQPLFDGFTLVVNRVIDALRRVLVGSSSSVSYFDRHGGRDHVFLWPSGAGPNYYLDWRKTVRNAIFLSPECGCSQGLNDVLPPPRTLTYTGAFFAAMGAPREPTVACVEGVMADSGQRYFVPGKDVVVPGHTDLKELGGKGRFVDPSLDRKRRPHLLQYCGDFDKSNERRIAGRIAAARKAFPDVRVLRKCESLKEQARSLFCLAPTGHSPWTLRFYEALFSGCVPVLLNRAKFLPPFPSVVPWDKILVRFEEKPAKDFGVFVLIRELELMAKRPREPPPSLGGPSLAERQALVKKFRAHVFYDPRRHDGRPNAYEHIVDELTLRHAALAQRLAAEAGRKGR